MSAHTPGPWHVGEGQQSVIVYAPDGWAVANATTYHGGTVREIMHANARLIAQAPAMADALRAIVWLAEEAVALRAESDDEEDHEMLDAYRTDVATAHAILATIEGK